MRHGSDVETPTVAESEPPPTGLPNEDDEIIPLGVPADADEDGDPERPGFPEEGGGDRAG